MAAGYAADHALIARFSSDGAADPTFGSGGVVLMPSGVDAPVAALALHSNGNLVVAYGGTSGGASGIWLTQLLPGGAPDPTFGFAGSTFTPLATAPTVRAMTIQPDDTILVIAAPNLLLRFGADVAIAVEVPALESWFLPLLATLVAAGAWKFGRRA